MPYTIPPIVKLAERVLVEIEQAVCRFPRRFKYTVGADLRAQAAQVYRNATRAWRNRERQRMYVERLVDAIDDLKGTLQIGSKLKAFASFAQFEMLSRIAHDLGKQAGGWKKQQQHPKGQNASAGTAPSQRAKILSTRAASQVEAHP